MIKMRTEQMIKWFWNLHQQSQPLEHELLSRYFFGLCSNLLMCHKTLNSSYPKKKIILTNYPTALVQNPKLGYGLFQNVKISKNTEFSTGFIRWRWKLVLSIELHTHSVSNSKLHLKLKSKVKYEILWNTYEPLLMQSQVKRWYK